MASAVIAREDDRTLKYNILLQSKPNPGSDGKNPVMLCKFNKTCNSIETQFVCHASDNSELSKWTKNTVIINDFLNRFIVNPPVSRIRSDGSVVRP